ncbi:MAG: Asp23/Gls24 family envelope stress response protein [Ruminococcaceae bacterium]|nr:Asp23/Gls24 family envelope stress response protein [Oscillospiraceae bacterium]
MAEIKDYITQTQENGAIHISQDVISTIAAIAVSEVEGVYALGSSQGGDIAELFGRKNSAKAVRLSVNEEDAICVECNVVAIYGYSVVELAKNVQESVCSAIESMTALKVASVDVNVCGISMKK